METTFYPLSQYGLKLKFVDIDETLNFDLDQLRELLQKTKLIMVVNLLGNLIILIKLKILLNQKKF